MRSTLEKKPPHSGRATPCEAAEGEGAQEKSDLECLFSLPRPRLYGSAFLGLSLTLIFLRALSNLRDGRLVPLGAIGWMCLCVIVLSRFRAGRGLLLLTSRTRTSPDIQAGLAACLLAACVGGFALLYR